MLTITDAASFDNIADADDIALMYPSERASATNTGSLVLWGGRSPQMDNRRMAAVGRTRNDDAGRPRAKGGRKWVEARHAADMARFDCTPLWVL